MEVTVVEGFKYDSSGQLRMCLEVVLNGKGFSLCLILGTDIPSPHQKPPALSVSAFGPPQRQLQGENELVFVFNSAGSGCVSALGWGKSFQ